MSLAGVLMRLPGALDAQLQRDAGISHAAWVVLAMLSESPTRSRRMSDLARRANQSQSRLSHTVARLEERGWVRRERSPQDGRGSVAVLTEEGYAKVVAVAPAHVAAVRSAVFDALSPPGLGHLEAACTELLATIGARRALPPRLVPESPPPPVVMQDNALSSLASAIGARVRLARQSRGWTLDRLAATAGVSRRMLVNVEQGAANPSVGTLLKLGDALGVGLPALVEPPPGT